MIHLEGAKALARASIRAMELEQKPTVHNARQVLGEIARALEELGASETSEAVHSMYMDEAKEMVTYIKEYR